jgi:hypothetical protein
MAPPSASRAVPDLADFLALVLCRKRHRNLTVISSTVFDMV